MANIKSAKKRILVNRAKALRNQMLKSQGLKELAMPNLAYRQLMLQRRREKLLESQKTEESSEK